MARRNDSTAICPGLPLPAELKFNVFALARASRSAMLPMPVAGFTPPAGPRWPGSSKASSPRLERHAAVDVRIHRESGIDAEQHRITIRRAAPPRPPPGCRPRRAFSTTNGCFSSPCSTCATERAMGCPTARPAGS